MELPISDARDDFFTLDVFFSAAPDALLALGDVIVVNTLLSFSASSATACCITWLMLEKLKGTAALEINYTY